MSLTSPLKKLATSRCTGIWEMTRHNLLWTCYGFATGSYGETGVMDFGLYAASPTHCITTSRRRLDATSVGRTRTTTGNGFENNAVSYRFFPTLGITLRMGAGRTHEGNGHTACRSALHRQDAKLSKANIIEYPTSWPIARTTLL